MKISQTIGWHVLYVKSRYEIKVNDTFERMTLDSFLPMTEEIHKWSDRKKKILKPLFPSYVFVNIKSSLDFYKVLSVNGACSFIRFGQQYATVSESEINKIKIIVSTKELSNVEVINDTPEIGDIKKIVYGSMMGIECEVIKSDNKNKIIVRIDSLKKNITATLPMHYLENI